MNLLGLAERLAADGDAPVHLNTERCLHAVDKFSRCTACHEACPVEAIQPTKPPTIQVEACRFCRACLPICPTGALTMEDEVADLLRCASRLGQKKFEIVCEHHPDVRHGTTPAAIRIRGCLAGLGPATYLHLAAQAPEQIVIRTDGCEVCPWSHLVVQIRQQLAEAIQLLQGWGRDDLFEEYDQAEPTCLSRRPVYPADSPPVSRRDLLRLESTPDAVKFEIPGGTHPFRERLRLLAAARHFGPLRPNGAQRSMPGSSYTLLHVSDTCTACGTCARACPSGALELKQDEKAGQYALQFSAQACLACGVCAHLCPEEAIQMEQRPTLGRFFNGPAVATLRKGRLQRCDRCNAWFAPRTGDDQRLCSICAFRRQNPFGSRLPSNIARALDQDTQKVSHGDTR